MKTSNRLSNIELLRIISMFLIVASHYAHHGIWLDTPNIGNWLTGDVFHKLFTCFLIQGDIGVGAYFLITGFFSVGKNYVSPMKIVRKVIVYSLFFGLIGMIISLFIQKQGNIYNYVITSFILPLSEGYWFCTVYLLLIICIPFMNPHLEKLSKKNWIFLIIFLFIFEYLIANIFATRYSNFGRGLLFYCIGFYFRKYHNNLKNKYTIIYLFIFLICVFCNGVCYYFLLINHFSGFYNLIIQALIKTFVCIASISLFLFFRLLDIKNSPTINFISNSTFGIYLIHENVFIRDLLWFNKSNFFISQYNSDFYYCYAIITIICIFISCIIIDIIFNFLTECMLKKKSRF